MDPRQALAHQRTLAPMTDSTRARMKRLAERDGFVGCVYCLRRLPFEELVLEHIIPRSRGGTNGDANRALACAKCDRDKRARTPQEWLPGQDWDVPIVARCGPAPKPMRSWRDPLPLRKVDGPHRPNLRAVPEVFESLAWCEFCELVVAPSDHECLP